VPRSRASSACARIAAKKLRKRYANGLQTGNLGLRDPRSIIPARDMPCAMFGRKVSMRLAAAKPGERPYLVPRTGVNRSVLLEAAASAAGCVSKVVAGRDRERWVACYSIAA
jgi:hypothetical protein